MRMDEKVWPPNAQTQAKELAKAIDAIKEM
jgi:hypothetical protein